MTKNKDDGWLFKASVIDMYSKKYNTRSDAQSTLH